jgi:hypothetical protein
VEFDNLFGTPALERWSEAQDRLLERLFGYSGAPVPPSVAEVYHRVWQHPVAGALMVAQVRRTKFDVSDPFLLVVHFPTVLSRGYTGPIFREASLKARFSPSRGMVPEGGAMPFIGGVETNLRADPGANRDWMATSDNAVVGFGPKAFSHIVVPWPDVASSEHALVFSDLFRSWDALGAGGTGTSGSDIRVGADPPPGHNCGGIRIPVMLPLAAPMCVPAGILGKPSLGVNGLKALVEDAYGKKRDHRMLVDWLDHPVVTAWLTVATMHHKRMAIEVMGRQACAGSLQPEPDVMSPYDVFFANTLVAGYWKALELTLAFRYFVDFVVGREKLSASARLFHQYLVKAAQSGLYNESNILGTRPWEMAYEVLFLRPPKSGPWKSGRWNPFVVGSQWMIHSLRCPKFLRDYIVEVFDPSKRERSTLKRCDGSKDPVFSADPDEPEEVGPAGDPFPSHDQRICNPDNACGEFEQQERLLMDHLQKSIVESATDKDELFPDLEAGDPTVAAELKSWRLRPLSERHIVRPAEPQAPAPVGQKRSAGVNPFRFLLETAQKRKKLSEVAVHSTPPCDALVHGLGINPRNVILHYLFLSLRSAQRDTRKLR